LAGFECKDLQVGAGGEDSLHDDLIFDEDNILSQSISILVVAYQQEFDKPTHTLQKLVHLLRHNAVQEKVVRDFDAGEIFNVILI